MKVTRIFFRLVSCLDHRRASLDTQDSLLEPRKPHHHQHWIPLMTPIVKTSSLGLNKSRRNLSTANYVWFILFFSLIICTLCRSTIKSWPSPPCATPPQKPHLPPRTLPAPSPGSISVSAISPEQAHSKVEIRNCLGLTDWRSYSPLRKC